MGTELQDNIFDKLRSSAVPFTALAVLLLFLSLLIVKPMGKPLIWSAVLSYLAYPFYKYVHIKVFKGKMANVSAGLTTVVILVFLAIPMLIGVLFLTRETIKVYSAIIQSGILTGSFSEILENLKDVPLIGYLLEHLGIMNDIPLFDTIIDSGITWTTRLLTKMSSEILGNAFKVFYLLTIVTVSSFFFVRDGEKLTFYIQSIIPLPRSSRADIIKRAANMLHSVFFGIIFTAAIQGVLGGIGWKFVGLNNPVFFGSVMFFTGMIPFVGTPVVWVPGAVALFIRGDVVNGFLLLAWGLGVVSMIDNFLRPIFISGGSNIHVLIVFVGIFGGLYNWGFLGLFIGPLMLSLGMFVLDVYKVGVLKRGLSDPE